KAAERRAERVEERDGDRAHLEREDLADREVGRARRGRGDEEDARPCHGELDRAERIAGEEEPGKKKANAGPGIRRGDHHAPSEGVEEAAEDERAEEIA